MSKNNFKEPRLATQPTLKKYPTIGSQFVSNDSGQVYWSFSLIDCEGPYGFHDICRNEFHKLVTNDFKSREGLSWADLKRNGCHNIQTNKIINKAKKRLSEIYLDEHEELFSMRFTGKKRVWGIRDGNVFKLLWRDPNHEICPSEKKYT